VGRYTKHLGFTSDRMYPEHSNLKSFILSQFNVNEVALVVPGVVCMLMKLRDPIVWEGSQCPTPIPILQLTTICSACDQPKWYNLTSFISMIIKLFWGWAHSKIYFGVESGLRQTTISFKSVTKLFIIKHFPQFSCSRLWFRWFGRLVWAFREEQKRKAEKERNVRDYHDFIIVRCQNQKYN